MNIVHTAQAVAADGLVVADGLIDKVNDLTNQTTLAVKAIVVLVGIVIALVTIIKNPTFGRVVLGVSVGAFIAGLPWLIPLAGELFKGDLSASGMGLSYDYLVQGLGFSREAIFMKS